MPSGCVGRRISHTSKDPARLFYYLSATQHSVAIGEIFARTALWKHSIQLFHLNYYSFFFKVSVWSVRMTVRTLSRPPCVAFSRDFWCDFVFRVQLFIPPQIIFTTTDKHGETTGFKTNGKCPQSNVFSQTFIFSPLSGGFLCTNSWHFPKNDICKIRPCECECFKWTRPEESDRKRRPHKKTDGLGYAISLTTGQQKSSHALDKGA